MLPGPGFWTTFLYYFATTVVIGGLTASQALHISPTSPTAVQVGILLGAIAGLGGAYFNRSVIWALPIQGRKIFLNRLEQSLQALKLEALEEDDLDPDLFQAPDDGQGEPQGSSKESKDATVRVYGSSGAGSFFSGRLYVKVQSNTAELMGRASTIKRLKQLL